ncbi:hypothetical protein BJ742DRAFT_745407 [Cladochytrium replicatum]|nr:hypothetical protein BJ742DRAFT_745407 [Cladochytrium replicatum]
MPTVADLVVRIPDKIGEEGDDDDNEVGAVTDEPVFTLRETILLLEKALKRLLRIPNKLDVINKIKGGLKVLKGLLAEGMTPFTMDTFGMHRWVQNKNGGVTTILLDCMSTFLSGDERDGE